MARIKPTNKNGNEENTFNFKIIMFSNITAVLEGILTIIIAFISLLTTSVGLFTGNQLVIIIGIIATVLIIFYVLILKGTFSVQGTKNGKKSNIKMDINKNKNNSKTKKPSELGHKSYN